MKKLLFSLIILVGYAQAADNHQDRFNPEIQSEKDRYYQELLNYGNKLRRQNNEMNEQYKLVKQIAPYCVAGLIGELADRCLEKTEYRIAIPGAALGVMALVVWKNKKNLGVQTLASAYTGATLAMAGAQSPLYPTGSKDALSFLIPGAIIGGLVTYIEIIKGVMNYDMHCIIARCKKDHHYTDEDMVLLERELKRYLILCIFNKNGESGRGMYSKDVDNLWHSFILFTREYTAFSEKFNGKYLHHTPEIDEKRGEKPEKVAAMRKDFQAFVAKYEQMFGELHPIWLLDACEFIMNKGKEIVS